MTPIQKQVERNMATKLHFWNDGDASVGIGRNDAVVELNLDGYNEAETADNLALAKEVLSKAFVEIWDNDKAHVSVSKELDHPNALSTTNRPARS